MKLVNDLWNSSEVSKYLSAGLEHPVSVQLTYNRMNVKWKVNLIGISVMSFLSHFLSAIFVMIKLQYQVTCKLEAISALYIYNFVVTILKGLQTYSKLDANIQGFSENAQ